MTAERLPIQLHEDLLITSVANPRVKQAAALRDRRGRDRRSELLIEGYREIRQALRHHHPVTRVFYCPELFLGDNEPSLLLAAKQAGAETIRTSAHVMRRLAYRDRPDGLLAVGAAVRRSITDLRLPEQPLLVVAEAIEKPGNLGTMLRSADGAGASAVIVCDPTTDLNNPNVVRASVGTLFSVPVAEADPQTTLEFLRQREITVVAATPTADRSLWDADLSRAVAIVVGSEQLGLSRFWLNAADVRVSIPMRGAADSLNVATATTILLYEALRQRRIRD